MGCEGNVIIRIFFYFLKIFKFIGVCMGLGKGFFEKWYIVVKVNIVMFEVLGVFEEIVCDVFRLGGYKLLVLWKIIIKSEGDN